VCRVGHKSNKAAALLQDDFAIEPPQQMVVETHLAKFMTRTAVSASAGLAT
jgi:hypothetical protein